MHVDMGRHLKAARKRQIVGGMCVSEEPHLAASKVADSWDVKRTLGCNLRTLSHFDHMGGGVHRS